MDHFVPFRPFLENSSVIDGPWAIPSASARHRCPSVSPHSRSAGGGEAELPEMLNHSPSSISSLFLTQILSLEDVQNVENSFQDIESTLH